MRWVGIDEAGYGPNLGPMVMTAVVAESTAGAGANSRASTLDFWGDLAATVDRAGGDPDRIWVDDSKAILHGGKGRDRLEIACLAAVHAARDELPGCLGDLVAVLGAGSLADIELARWVEARSKTGTGLAESCQPARLLDALLASRPLVPRRARHGGSSRWSPSWSDRPGSMAAWRSTARRRRSISRRSTGCSSRSGIGPPTAGRRSSRATSTAAGTTTCSRSRRPFPTRGSTAAPRALT